MTTTERTITVVDGNYVILFPYNKTLVVAVKNLDGRKYEPTTKSWLVPIRTRSDVWQFVEENDFTVTPEVVASAKANVKPVDAELGGSLQIKSAKFWIKFPYDPEAVSAVKEINGRRWDVDNKVWIAPLSSVRAVRDFVDRFGLETIGVEDIPDSDPVIEPTISLDQQSFIIRFEYDRDLAERVRDIPTASWDSVAKGWRISKHATHDVAEFARTSTAVIEKSSVEILDEAVRQMQNIQQSRATDAELVIPTLNGTLLPFQRAGVLYTLNALGFRQQENGTWSV
jgi:hypothetical protein